MARFLVRRIALGILVLWRINPEILHVAVVDRDANSVGIFFRGDGRRVNRRDDLAAIERAAARGIPLPAGKSAKKPGG